MYFSFFFLCQRRWAILLIHKKTKLFYWLIWTQTTALRVLVWIQLINSQRSQIIFTLQHSCIWTLLKRKLFIPDDMYRFISTQSNPACYRRPENYILWGKKKQKMVKKNFKKYFSNTLWSETYYCCICFWNEARC